MAEKPEGVPAGRLLAREVEEDAGAARGAPPPAVARVAVPALGRGGDRILDYRVPAELAGVTAVGSVVRVPVREREARGLVLALTEWPDPALAPGALRALRSVEPERVPGDLVDLVGWLAESSLAPLASAAGVLLPPPAPRRRARTLAWHGPEPDPSDGPAVRVADLLRDAPGTRADLVRAGASPSAIDRLRRDGYVVETAAVAGAPGPGTGAGAAEREAGEAAVDRGPSIRLSAEQARCAARASAAIGSGRGFLLVGPTGSGKTEVYLETIAAALRLGRSAIVLVPEIALTPQTVDRFARRFGARVAVLHSGLTEGERHAAWRRLRQGEAQVAVGPRSAVWAPVAGLGVVVVDEEPEASYRGDRAPRYDARAVALERARRTGAVVVFGSATPSLEALQAAAEGRLERLDLGTRAGGRALPAVEIVDLRAERARPGGRGGLVTPVLARALEETLGRGEQAIILLNRRGYHPVCLCRDCGQALTCSACDVSLTLHADRGLLCHYCGRSQALPALCPHCAGPHLGGLGAGTQRLVEELGRLVPRGRVLRLDRDSVRHTGEMERILAAFARGEADVLVGTQMVAKGHDLPGVTLVGVVLADQGLRYPDLRAAERTAQLLVQAAGRAGRGSRPGRVVLQTYEPDHAAVAAAGLHDYLGFARGELERRRDLGYPPFGVLAVATLSGVVEARVDRAAHDLAAAMAGGKDGRLLGPAPPPVPRMDGRHRRQLMIVSPDGAAARAAARRLLAVALPPAVRLDVLVDPA